MSQDAVSSEGQVHQRNALVLLVAHFWRLATATATGWWRHAPWLVGFMLLAATARYASLLVTSQIAIKVPYLIMVSMSFGLLVNIVMIILAIRVMIQALGIGEQPGIRQVLERSVAPFLVIYLAFGYMSTYSSTMMYVIQTRFSYWKLGDLLDSLNPAHSTRALVTVVVIFIGSFVLGYLLSFIQSKTSASWLSLADAFLQAVRWVLGVFSITRIGEQVRYWVFARQFSQWRDETVDWLSSALHINLPDLFGRVWGMFTGTVWPGLWQLLVYPLVWFALVIVVVGGRLIDVNAMYERVMQPKNTSFVRREILERMLGGVNAKLLPVLHALRDMIRATVPFLGAYVILFTLLTWAGQGLERLAWMVIGSQGDQLSMALLPLVDAISSVLVMSLKIALLVVAYQQASALANQPHPPRRTFVVHGVMVVLLAAALVAAQSMIGAGADTTVKTAAPNGMSTFLDSRVTVYNLRVGTDVPGTYGAGPTSQRYIAITVKAYATSSALRFTMSLSADGHTYDPFDNALWLTTTPGFTATTDYLFEVNTADLKGPVYADVTLSGGIQYQGEKSRFRLDPAVLSAPSDGQEVQYDPTVRQRLP